jgi:hypothetical protein
MLMCGKIPADGIFADHGWVADQLSPWVALDRATASSLLDDFLRHSSRQSIFVDCLKDSKWAIPLVCSKGFDFVRPLTRMYRGENCLGQLVQCWGRNLGDLMSVHGLFGHFATSSLCFRQTQRGGPVFLDEPCVGWIREIGHFGNACRSSIRPQRQSA